MFALTLAGLAAPAAAHAETACADLVKTKLPHGVVTKAVVFREKVGDKQVC